jgi:hypothetical protein
LSSVMYHSFLRSAEWGTDQVTNIVLLLVTASAAVATLIFERDFGGVAARLVTGLRALGLISTALPIVTAGFLAYARDAQKGLPPTTKTAVASITAASLLIVLVATTAWVMAWRDERRTVTRSSPWDMTEDQSPPLFTNFWRAMAHYQFDSAAIGIRSAEGWHERYMWTDDKQKTAVTALRALCLCLGAKTETCLCRVPAARAAQAVPLRGLLPLHPANLGVNVDLGRLLPLHPASLLVNGVLSNRPSPVIAKREEQPESPKGQDPSRPEVSSASEGPGNHKE